MSRKTIIIVLIVLWLISLVVAGVAINYYIENKKVSLNIDLCDKIKKLFDGQSSGGAFVTNNDGFFDVAYSGYPVKHYKEVSIPSKSQYIGSDSSTLIEIKEKLKDSWEKKYSDLEALYELNWGDKYPNNYDDGWAIMRIHYTPRYPDIIETNMIFPYKVGLRRTEWGYNDYSIEQAVKDAYDFYTTSDKSGFSERFEKGSIRELWSKIYDCQNKYYSIAEREKPLSWTVGIPIKAPKGMSYEEVQRTMPYENGYMYNGFCRVLIAATQVKQYYVKENELAINEDTKNYQIWWMSGLSILFLSIIIPLYVAEKRTVKRISESLYQRLLRLCNPKEFMVNYDKNKVEKANSLYSLLLKTNPDDKDALMEIQMKASSELGINFIDKDELEELKEKVNPKNFLNPYNAEKVSLANELYATLAKDDLTYKEFIEVKQKSKEL